MCWDHYSVGWSFWLFSYSKDRSASGDKGGRDFFKVKSLMFAV